MDQEIFDKLVKIINKKYKKQIVIVDSQKNKRFLNEHVYKNLEKIINKKYCKVA